MCDGHIFNIAYNESAHESMKKSLEDDIKVLKTETVVDEIVVCHPIYIYLSRTAFQIQMNN